MENPKEKDYHTLVGSLKRETEKAILVELEDSIDVASEWQGKRLWIPLSQVASMHHTTGELSEFLVAKWFLRNKGVI